MNNLFANASILCLASERLKDIDVRILVMKHTDVSTILKKKKQIPTVLLENFRKCLHYLLVNISFFTRGNSDIMEETVYKISSQLLPDIISQKPLMVTIRSIPLMEHLSISSILLISLTSNEILLRSSALVSSRFNLQ